jgi:hypothetical protein
MAAMELIRLIPVVIRSMMTGAVLSVASREPYTDQQRLNRLEQTVSALVERLRESGMHIATPDVSNPSPKTPQVNDPSGTNSAAPVLLIRDVAYEVGVRQQPTIGAFARTPKRSLNIIDRGLITTQQASVMIELFASIPLSL